MFVDDKKLDLKYKKCIKGYTVAKMNAKVAPAALSPPIDPWLV
jgi:hypothetical protein